MACRAKAAGAAGRTTLTPTAAGLSKTYDEYPARRAPVRAEFRGRHPEDHGEPRYYEGGPIHCSRCCPHLPLSPQQVAAFEQLGKREDGSSAETPAPTPRL